MSVCILAKLSSDANHNFLCRIMSSGACLALPYFSALYHKWHDFQEKNLLNTNYVFIFSTTLKHFSFYEAFRDLITNVHTSSRKLHVTSQSLLKIGTFTDFRKILKYKVSGKSVQWESSCFMWTDGQT